ncbi:hypothetical protein PHLCEN_2v9548 [Hermanssonia centrifuga]|uniref:thioredoxin-dependent peroxiredoxin n=1 Tax=Hermanssonia centrifuga TaxID=98765 RepID=A0A2R6NQL6_9APHY|nr:hypothetical protein PHLCEN_2v9548 [Hermanssonia centrifuga]
MTRSPLTNKPAPAISLPNANGETYNLAPESAGVPVALFFYPKSGARSTVWNPCRAPLSDNTPPGSFGCTKEACEFRDALAGREVFKSSKALVVGISPDPVEKQKEFVEKQKLNYPVLSDTKGEARKAYHVGKGLLGLVDARVTFVIDAKGVVRDSLDATMNYGAHVKFVNKWLVKLEEEERQANAPPPKEPGLITEPALATEDDSPAHPPAGIPEPASPGVPPTGSDVEREELVRAAATVQG